jgi:5-methylcytosine-specific restriction endonuclease McrA
MGRPINNKCLECSKVIFKHKKVTKPECYIKSACAKKRCYYRQIEHYRSKLRSYHRYLKFLGNKCLVCGKEGNLQAHHIHSQAQGGIDTQANIVTLCVECHKVITIYTRRIGTERKLLE